MTARLQSPHLVRSATLHLVAGATVVATLLTGSAFARSVPEGPSSPAVEKIAAAMRPALAGPLKIVGSESEVLPPGWDGFTEEATVVRVSDGRTTYTLSFITLDWIGVQTDASSSAGLAEVRWTPFAKVILHPSAGADWSWVEKFAPATTSLAQATTVPNAFIGQARRVNTTVNNLLRRSRGNTDLVVGSLIALGVPAEEQIRQLAASGSGSLQLSAIRALRAFPGSATEAALLSIISNRSRSADADSARMAAVACCHDLMITGHGAAVHAALQTTRDEGTAATLANEINDLRYRDAADDLVRWLKDCNSPENRPAFARALATLRVVNAADSIRSAMNAAPARRAAVNAPTEAAARAALEIELHRLTGLWGPVQNDVRLSLAMSAAGRLVVYVENMGVMPYEFLPSISNDASSWPTGLKIELNGEIISPRGGDTSLSEVQKLAHQIQPGHAMRFELDVTDRLPSQGEHRLTVSWFGVRGNELVVRSPQSVALR